MSDVVVIGAGMAGLSAALRLMEEGLSVTVVEACHRVGGRIFSERIGNCDVEMGAEFVHGLPQETLMLLKRYGLKHYELDGEMLVYDGEGNLHKQDEDSAEDESPFSLLEEMTRWAEVHPHRDVPFAEWLAEQNISEGEKAGAIGYVKGFNAADHRVIGVQGLARQQRAEDAIEGDRLFHVEGGYARLPEALADDLRTRGAKILFGFNVQQVRWGNDVAVIAADRREVQARAAVVTLPLGVLQKQTVQWSPEISDIDALLPKLRMGPVVRVSLVFKRRWWAERGHARMSFLFPEKRNSKDGTPRFEVFWTPYPNEQPMVTAWTGGPSAKRFDGMTRDAIVDVALRSLERAFGMGVHSLENEFSEAHVHDWQEDKYAFGAYSYVPAGSLEHVEKMTEPVGGVLFFAGEHTDTTGHWGTVHGAIRSGVRAARQVMSTLRRS